MQSRVHPTYQTKYRVANWASYDRALVGRGDVTLWLAPEAIDAWAPGRVGTRGGQFKYSDLAIETALTRRLIFHLPLRQAEGFLNSLFGMMGIDRSAPDHTTLSRRSQHLDLTLRGVPTDERLPLIVDSTGLSIVGEGEWAAGKHGRRGKRGWKQLHVGVDRSGVIVAQALTEGCRRPDDGSHADRGSRRRPRERHGGRGLRHDRLLRCCGCTWRDRGRSTAQGFERVSTRTAVERPRSHDQDGEGTRAATVEAGGGLPAASSGRERLLPVQIDHRGWPSSPHSRRASGRGTPRVQPPESDDRPGQARVVRHRSVKRLWSGSGRANSDSCTNAKHRCNGSHPADENY